MKSIFEVKSARMDALSIQLKSQDTLLLEQALLQRFKQLADVHSMPFLLDVHELPDAHLLNLAALLPIFQRYGLRVIGLRHTDAAFARLAARHGLAFSLLPESRADTQIQSYTDQANATRAPEPAPAPKVVAEPAPPVQAAPPAAKPTVMVTQPIRTGQQVYAQNADLIVMSAVSVGAEIIADGNIHVYGPLRGRALAGANGNKQARIFAQSMQAELVSVAGIYRTFEQDLPVGLNQKPVQVYLQDERLVISAIHAE